MYIHYKHDSPNPTAPLNYILLYFNQICRQAGKFPWKQQYDNRMRSLKNNCPSQLRWSDSPEGGNQRETGVNNKNPIINTFMYKFRYLLWLLFSISFL